MVESPEDTLKHTHAGMLGRRRQPLLVSLGDATMQIPKARELRPSCTCSPWAPTLPCLSFSIGHSLSLAWRCPQSTEVGKPAP